MNTLIRGLGLGVVLSAVLILPGCSTDNESDATKLQAGSGAVPKPEEGTTVQDTGPQPKSLEDYAKQQQASSPYLKGNYPGAPKAGAPATKKK